MFTIIKQKIDIVDAISKEMGVAFKKIGGNNYAPEDETCPFCGHKDCFRLFDDGRTSFYKCHSGACGEFGDVISFVAAARDIKPIEAARALAKEYGIVIPNDYSPVQEIFNLAAGYYHTCLKETCNRPYAELNQLTPLEYQKEIRRHKVESIDHFKLGWSDGNLITYLKGVGFENEIVEQSGLMNAKGGDFLPTKAFIYPHYVKGKVSHFTFKDPLKKAEYQLKNKSKLNNHVFYNSDTLEKSEVVAIVEGENDLISVHEAGWQHGLIATIGQISSQQLEWIENHLQNKKIITLFDSDDAGNKYREKVERLKKKFISLTQVKLPNVKDIDEFLVNGGNLGFAITNHATQDELVDLIKEDDEEDAVSQDLNIVEKDGCYYKIRYKDGMPVQVKLTNFTMSLKNVFIKENERQREIVVKRFDGVESEPVTVSSECKVSLKAFKTFLADAVDASFYGQETDLTAMWEYVYTQGSERLVYIPPVIGKIDEFKGWLFRDQFITDTGAVIKPDEEGIMWIGGHTTGIKPMSLNTESAKKKGSQNLDIPSLINDYAEDERRSLLKQVVQNLSKNLGDPGMALIILGWAKANVYSNFMFTKIGGGFPFLYFWGKHGEGKTVIAKWLSCMFNMEDSGYDTLSQYKTGVGFGRKIAYYSSLPMIMDEMRADPAAIANYGNFRGWYNRAGRPLGVKDGNGWKQQQVRSNFIFVGQDLFTDSALKQRCVPIRIPVVNRELTVTYAWMEQHKGEFSSIGYHWILESSTVDFKRLSEEYKMLDKQLVANGCEPRTAKNWACVGVFAKTLCDEFMPNFNFYEYLFRVTKEDTQSQKEDGTVERFFMLIEAMQVAENSKLNGEHIKRDGRKLYIWFHPVFNLVNDENRTGLDERFSRNALKAEIREELYYVNEDNRKMGLSNTKRKVLIIDLDKAPETLQNIGENCAA